MDKMTKLSLSSYNALRADAAEKLRVADRLGVHIAAKLILSVLPSATTLQLLESEQNIEFEWEFGYLLDAAGTRFAYIDTDSITLIDGTVIPFEDGVTVWTVITELPERIPTVNDLPAAEYTSWFQPDGNTARINIAAAASDDA